MDFLPTASALGVGDRPYDPAQAISYFGAIAPLAGERGRDDIVAVELCQWLVLGRGGFNQPERGPSG